MAEAKNPPRLWVLHCPFRKNGSPVLGTFGATERAVVIMTLDTWQQLVADVPALQATQFEVGTAGGTDA